MKSTVPRLKPKQIKYRSYKKFVPEKFLKDVKQAKFDCDDRDSNKSYDHLTNTFRNLVEKHAPIKTKFSRGNNALFMNPELKKRNLHPHKAEK